MPPEKNVARERFPPRIAAATIPGDPAQRLASRQTFDTVRDPPLHRPCSPPANRVFRKGLERPHRLLLIRTAVHLTQRAAFLYRLPEGFHGSAKPKPATGRRDRYF